MVVQTAQENTKYRILDDVILKKSKKRYLELENVINDEHREVEIFYLIGTKTILIKEDVKQNVYLSPKFLYSKIIGNALVVEDTF